MQILGFSLKLLQYVFELVRVWKKRLDNLFVDFKSSFKVRDAFIQKTILIFNELELRLKLNSIVLALYERGIRLSS